MKEVVFAKEVMGVVKRGLLSSISCTRFAVFLLVSEQLTPSIKQTIFRVLKRHSTSPRQLVREVAVAEEVMWMIKKGLLSLTSCTRYVVFLLVSEQLIPSIKQKFSGS